jgi:hypothetical protein
VCGFYRALPFSLEFPGTLQGYRNWHPGHQRNEHVPIHPALGGADGSGVQIVPEPDTLALLLFAWRKRK